MKTKALGSTLILLLAVLIISGSCATGKKAQIPDKVLFKKLNGTWVNEDYDALAVSSGWWESKRVVRLDGTYDWFANSSDIDRTGYGEYKTIVETWTDIEGNFFYKATVEEHFTTSEIYEIGKIDRSGTVWERVWSGVDFPPEIDPNHSNYHIFYRQE